MKLRFWPAWIFLCIFCVTANIVAAKSLNPLPAGTDEKPADTSVIKDLSYLCVYEVKDGQIRQQIYTAENLVRQPYIQVEGYVTGIILLSNSQLNISVENSPMNQIQINHDGNYHLKNFGEMSPRAFLSAFHPESGQPTQMEDIRGKYSCFAKIPGSALSSHPEFHLIFQNDNRSCYLPIHQAESRSIECADETDPKDKTDFPKIVYHGNNPGPFESVDAHNRLHAFQAGILSVERIVGRKLVNRIHILEYSGSNNAYTLANENDIWIYRELFWNESPEELKIIAEHETLHLLTDAFCLTQSNALRTHLAEVMGYGPLSMERFFLVTAGRLPVDPNDAETRKTSGSIFFAFVNEANYLRGMKGGHSQDNLNEFCTSFLHTMMYPDRLDHMLSEPLILPDGTIRQLSAQERRQLILDYAQTVQNMMNALSAQAPPQLTHFFQTGLEKAKTAETTFVAAAASSLGMENAAVSMNHSE